MLQGMLGGHINVAVDSTGAVPHVAAGKALSSDATTLLKQGLANVGAGKKSLATLRALLVKVSGQSAFSA